MMMTIICCHRRYRYSWLLLPFYCQLIRQFIVVELLLSLLGCASGVYSCTSSGGTVITDSSPVTSIVYQNVQPATPPNSSCGHSMFWNSGERPASYIVGGTSASNHEFPWQVYLLIVVGDRKGFTCGGAVIAPRFVMTAAHCCAHATSASDISVFYGANDLEGKTDNAVFSLLAAKIYSHSLYNESTLDYDFCILQMPDTYLLRNSGWAVQPICLPTSCSVTCQPSDFAIISGWGLTSEGGSTSKQLQKAFVPVLSTSTCAASYAGVESITDIKVCTGYNVGGVAPCNGDSGGPLACFKNGYFTLDGVVSNAVGCARSDFPAVYSRVCSVKIWIDSILVTATTSS